MICRITPSVPQFGMVHEFSLSRGGSSILTLGGVGFGIGLEVDSCL